jgi:flagellar hook protein FlgE
MLKSMYAGVTGMKSFQTKLDVIGNNIANVNTVGFKKSRVNFQDLMSQTLASNGVNPMQVGLGTKVSSIDVLHTQGSPMTTGIKADLAVQGSGFFVVGQEVSQGKFEYYLTRAGNFSIDNNRNLVTSQGFYVLDASGNKIVMPDEFEINGEGTIKNLSNNTTQTLAFTDPDNPQGLEKAGDTLYKKPVNQPFSSIAAQQSNSQIVAGQLEMSNVDLTEEFTEMIVAQRGFQSNSKLITTSDEILQEVVNLKR